MSEKTQLTRINVPAITDARYIEGMSDAFNKINDNFKKIASLPFLQGVQGDSYQLEEYKIWNDWTITEDGKILLDSIFGKDVTEKGNSFDSIRICIGEDLAGTSPIDFFKNGNDIVNNSLYFYVIKDDTGNVIEKQLGQYYYFIDGRLKDIGNVYNDGVSLNGFNDYTGFYQYKYDSENNSKYVKVEILPTIYYDQNKNDICWKFNGNETGISAIGVKGADGKDADLLIVRVTANENDCTGVVNAIINPIGGNTAEDQWIENPKDFKVGKALICIQRDNTAQDFAYGQVIESGVDFNAYWEPNYNFSKLIGNNRITNYFYNMGEDDTETSPFYLAIPSSYNRGASGTTTDKQKAHVIKGSSETSEDLNIFYSENAFGSNGEQKDTVTSSGSTKNLNIQNYNTNITKKLTVSGSEEVSGGLTVNNGGLSVKAGDLSVTNNATISKKLTVSGSAEVSGGLSVKNGGANITGGSFSVDTNGDNFSIKTTGPLGYGISCDDYGSMDINTSDLTIHGGVSMDSLGVTGTATINNLSILSTDSSSNTSSGALVVNGGVGIGENLNIKGTLGVTGAVTFDADLFVGGTLGVSGKITGNKGLEITTGGANITGGSFSVDTNGDDFSIKTTGPSGYGISCDDLGAMDISADDLTIRGGYVTMNGNVSMDSLSVIGKITGKAGLEVTGDANIKNGGITVGETANITGKITGNNGLEITTGGATISGAAGIYGDLNVEGNEIASGYISTEKYVKTPVIYALGTGDKTGRHGIVFGVETADEYEDDFHDHNSNHNSCIYSNYGDDLHYHASSHEFDGKTTINNKLTGEGGLEITKNGAIIYDGLYAKTKKPTSITYNGSANGLSNVLIGHNDPGNAQLEDFPKDLDKGGYPLVVKSLQSDGTNENEGAMVFGIGDIYALSGNNTTGYSAGTLCLNHRAGYRGDVQIGKNLNVGDNETGGNVTIYSSLDNNGRLIVKGTTGSTNTTTGALVVTGGAGIGGAVNIGGKITGNSGIKIIGGNSYGIDMYSGTGETTDSNHLKVDSNGVFVNGGAGKLVLNGTKRQLLIGSLASDNTFNAGIDINNTNDNTSTILFKGANPDNTAFANQMCITTNATRGTGSTNKYTVGRFYMDNNFDKQYIQIFTGYSGTNPIYGNSKAGIQILHDENDSTVDGVDIKPKLSVTGPITASGLIKGSSGINITGRGDITGLKGSDYLPGLGGTGGPGFYITGGSGSLPTGSGGTGGAGGTGAIITGGTAGLRGKSTGGVGIIAKGGKGDNYGAAIKTHGMIQIGDTSGQNTTTISSNSDYLNISRLTNVAGGLYVPLNHGITLTGLGSWSDISGYISIQEDYEHKQAHASLAFSDLMSTDYKKYTSNGFTSTNPAYGKGLVVLYGTGNQGTEGYSITITNCPSMTLFYFGVKVKNGVGAKDLDNVTVYIQGSTFTSKKAIYTFSDIEANSVQTREFLVFTNSSGGPQFWSHQ